MTFYREMDIFFQDFGKCFETATKNFYLPTCASMLFTPGCGNKGRYLSADCTCNSISTYSASPSKGKCKINHTASHQLPANDCSHRSRNRANLHSSGWKTITLLWNKDGSITILLASVTFRLHLGLGDGIVQQTANTNSVSWNFTRQVIKVAKKSWFFFSTYRLF